MNGRFYKHASRLLAGLAAVAALALAACHQRDASRDEPKSEEHKVFYALGLDIGRNVRPFSMSAAELEMVRAGLADAVNGRKPKVDLDSYRSKIVDLAQNRHEARTAAEKRTGRSAIESAVRESGAERLPSGIVVKTLRPGSGASPTKDDTVKVHYEGRLSDGHVFESSYERSQPSQFHVSGVIRCWTEGLQKAKVGSKVQMTCPPDVAYGDRGRPPEVPGGATLVFDMELLEIVSKQAPL